MLFAKKIKHILLVVFLASALSSCDEGCFEADQFYNKMKSVSARPDNFYGDYNDQNGGQIAEWQDTGLVANGDYFVISISGGWVANGGDSNSNEKMISKLNSCRICIKSITATQADNCYCGPTLDNGSLLGTPAQLKFETPQKEQYRLDGQVNNVDCSSANYNDPNICTCKPHAPITNDELFSDRYFVFSLAGLKKDTIATPRLNGEDNKVNYDSCANKLGFGAYISLWSRGVDAETPRVAYHLLSPRVVCAISRDSEGKCLDDNKIDRTKVIYTSPDAKIFLKTENPSLPPQANEYHKLGDRVKLAIYDQYFTDNGGKYNIEFLRGVIDESDEAGLIAGIVRTMERYLFGSSTYNDKLGIYITKMGVVEFMYKAILQDKIVANVILISLVMYVTFYGLAFFMGMVDYGKKEVMMRLLKIGLVVMFTNPKAWSIYNEFVVNFFKNGMDSVVAMISEIFESNMDPTLGSISAKQEANSANIDVGRKFIYIDNLIKDLISRPTIAKIFGLLLVPGKGIFAIIYIPVIFLLIGYFIYTMLDVALKYIVNLLKICIGLALGPIFILFSLFEKTKDMFKNWIAFLASRSLEIVILFTMLHPFLLIIDSSFKTMLGFRVCTEAVNNGVMKYSIYKSQGVDRGIFQWFEFFLKIAALIFVTKSICNKAAYISGQLISIGGVSNADSVSEIGHGQAGFNMASSIAAGALGLAKEAVTSGRVAKMAKFGGRLLAKGATKAFRANIGTSGSINDMVNGALKSIGIRNRGPRSYMRDRQIDGAISAAKEEAKNRGLEGEDKDRFIRANAMERINIFKANNKNEAVLLGLDNKNILKRFDQKLIKEPMKEFVKERAKELRQEGIFGKEAREKIDGEVQNWAKKNISPEVREQKVSEFMKKSSMQDYLRANAEMNASQAFKHADNLIQKGDAKDAQSFIDKFRRNAEENKVYLERQRQNRVKNAGNPVTKGLAHGVNFIVDAKNHAIGLKVPFMGNMAVDRNPRKAIRKFDRKLHRALANNPNQENLKQEGLKIPELQRVENKDVFVKKTDSTMAKVFKYGAQAVLSPVLIPAKMAQSRMGKVGFVRRATARASDALEKVNIKLKENPNDSIFVYGLKKFGKLGILLPRKIFKVAENQDDKNVALKELHKDAKMDTLRSLAKDQKAEFFADINSRRSGEDFEKRSNENDQQYQERIQRIEVREKKENPVNNLAIILENIDKRTKKETKKEIDKKIKKKEGQKKEIQEKKYQELKKLDTDRSEGETMFERLSKFEACRDDKKLDLKSVYMQSINESMKDILKELSGDKLLPEDKKTKMLDLEVLKEALFTDISQAKNNKYMESALQKVYEASPQNSNLDMVGGSNSNAQGASPAPNALKKEAIPQAKDKKSDFEKQKTLIGEIYESNKIAEEAKFYMGRQVSPISDGNSPLPSQGGVRLGGIAEGGKGGSPAPAPVPPAPPEDNKSIPAQPAPAPAEDDASMPAPPAPDLGPPARPVPPAPTRDPRKEFGGGVDRGDVENEDDS
jgi:type IV secretory pathway VirB6-like protein